MSPCWRRPPAPARKSLTWARRSWCRSAGPRTAGHRRTLSSLLGPAPRPLRVGPGPAAPWRRGFETAAPPLVLKQRGTTTVKSDPDQESNVSDNSFGAQGTVAAAGQTYGIFRLDALQSSYDVA